MFPGRKLPITLAFVVLIGLAFGVSCKGFFVNPTLNSIAVGPTGISVPIGSTQQMIATGTYSDTSQKDITSAKGIVWVSSDQTQATVSGSGLVTGIGIGNPTITAEMGTVSGQTTVEITLTNVTGITITPNPLSVKVAGGSVTCQAMATVSGSPTKVDVSAQANWTITNSADFTLTQGETPETVSTTSTATVGEQATLTATYTSGNNTFTATATVTVTQ